MSGDLNSIDLNSDVVSVDPVNDTAAGSDVSEKAMVRVSETSAESVNSQGGPTQGPMDDKVVDFQISHDGLGIGEKKSVVFDAGIDLEAEIGAGDTEIDAKTGVFGEEVGQLREKQGRLVGENGVTGNSGSVLADAIQVQLVGVLGSLSNCAGVEVKVINSNDVSSRKNDSVENHVMENDEQAKSSGGEILGNEVSDVGVSMENDSNNNDLSADGDVGDDEDEISDNNEPEFSVPDLVWGKVKSHPWWPGQIFDPRDASNIAKKYFKKGNYLIAYFGDQTFAWNDASMVKPFREYFLQMEKQSNLEGFRYAIDCALEEVSRRVEFGLACSCVPEYSEIETQVIVNAGIREDSCRRDGGDSFSDAAAFEPAKLVEYIKKVGEMPFSGVDQLEFVTAKAQLLAFSRWKGYNCLPEFQILVAWSENDALDIQLPSEVNHGSDFKKNANVKVKIDENVSSGQEHSKSLDYSTRKRKHIYGDSLDSSGEKEKSLAELLSERRSLVLNTKSKLESKATTELISSSSGKKRKADDSFSDDSGLKSCKTPLSSEVDSKSSQHKRTFRVGDSILRVASQLNNSTAILKSVNGASQIRAAKNKSIKKSFSAEPEGEKLFSVEEFLPDEMLKKLSFIAKDPKKACGFFKSIISIFTEFRNSVCLDPSDSLKFEESTEEHDSIIEKETMKPDTKTSELEHVKDSCCTDMVAESIPEEQPSHGNPNDAVEFPRESHNEEGTSIVEPESTVQLNPNLDSDHQIAEAVKPMDHLSENRNDDLTPTALILNFTNLDSVPSETKLNKIFSPYGLLKESETEVLKKSRRAKVVFRRRADAEAAFSSAGKYSIFGPSLVSYRLKYMPSAASKSSLNAKKTSKEDTSDVERNAT